MVDWIMKFFGLCEHKWDIHQEISVFDPDSSSNRPIGTKFVLRCAKCGDFKTYKTY